MEIIWMGHSCFRLRTGDLAMITDPFPDSIGLQMGEQNVLAVTVSHEHENHSYADGLGGNPKVLKGPGEYELSGIYITGIMTQPGEGDPEGKRNTACLIEIENLRLCHLGDVSNVLTTRQTEELTPVDVLFLPVGGICTVETPQAMEIMQNLNPKVVIPMHYALPGLRVELNSLDNFLRAMGLRDAKTQARLNLTTSSLPQETQVVILEAQGASTQA